MKRTGAGILSIAGAAGVALGFLTDQLLTAWGRPTATPVVSLPILLILLGALVLVLAVPIARSTRGSGAPVNPFRALRVAMLAKASSLVGAVVGGFGLGLIVFLLTRPVTPSVGSISAQIGTAISGAILIGASLVAEYLCTIRKDDDDDQPGNSEFGTTET